MHISNVQAVGIELLERMEAAGFDVGTQRYQQVMCLAEEVGEAVQAARRALGLARTPGTFKAVRTELADVVIAAATMAEVFGIDLNAAVAERCREVLNRPVRKEPDPPEESSGMWPTDPLIPGSSGIDPTDDCCGLPFGST